MANAPIDRTGTYTTHELARIFRCKITAVANAAKAGIWPAYLVPGSRFHRFEHDALLLHFLALGDADSEWFVDQLNHIDAEARDRELDEKGVARALAQAS